MVFNEKDIEIDIRKCLPLQRQISEKNRKNGFELWEQ
jgi:hypothetical protein